MLLLVLLPLLRCPSNTDSTLIQHSFSPHSGKITSRRIIYSQPNPMDIMCLPECCAACWCKRCETMDYRLIDDVSVEQGCADFMTGAGTIIVHCKGSLDTSIVAEERERLVKYALSNTNVGFNMTCTWQGAPVERPRGPQAGRAYLF